MEKRNIVAKGESLSAVISLRSTRTMIVMDGDTIVLDTHVLKEKEVDERYPKAQMSLLPQSRADAKEMEIKRYFTGKMCIHGHIAPRMVSTGTCVECLRLNSKKSYGKETVERNNAKRQGQNREYRQLLDSSGGRIRNIDERTVTDRLEAARQGKTYYYDPDPCSHGHINKLRYTNSGVCVECSRRAVKKTESKKFIKDIVIDNQNLLSRTTVVIG